jgi:hypothetical protein
MAIASKTYRGKRVSAAHHAMFTAYEREYGVPVQLNQGRRTLAEQTYFWNLYRSGRGNLAAFPNPRAPHIKFGSEHHANDINAGSGRGSAQHVAQYYRSKGVPVAFNVRSEPWHMDTLDEGALKRAAAKVGGSTGDPTLKYRRSGPAVVKLKKLLYDAGIRDFSTGSNGKPSSNRYNPFFGKNTKKAVQRFQREHKLPADGVVGPKTWRALRKVGT